MQRAHKSEKLLLHLLYSSVILHYRMHTSGVHLGVLHKNGAILNERKGATNMSSMDARPFGELLVTLRKQHGITQFALAAKLDVHRNTVSKWERGVCLPESKTLVLELAHQLRLDMYNTQRLLEASLTALSPYWTLLANDTRNRMEIRQPP